MLTNKCKKMRPNQYLCSRCWSALRSLLCPRTVWYQILTAVSSLPTTRYTGTRQSSRADPPRPTRLHSSSRRRSERRRRRLRRSFSICADGLAIVWPLRHERVSDLYTDIYFIFTFMHICIYLCIRYLYVWVNECPGQKSDAPARLFLTEAAANSGAFRSCSFFHCPSCSLCC